MPRIANVLKITLGVMALGVILFFWVGSDLERYVNRVDPLPLPGASDLAKRIHDSSFVVDLHADSLLFGRDLLVRSDVGHVDLPRLQKGGVGLQVFAAATKTPFGIDIHRTSATGIDFLTIGAFAQRSPLATLGPRDRALHQAMSLASMVERSDGQLVPLRSRADLDSLVAARTRDRTIVGALFALEGAHALEGEIANFDVFYDAGVRMIGLTHFFDNDHAGSAHGLEKGGLTAKGRELVALMERRGVTVDLAHLSPKAVDDVLGLVTKPTLVSHGGVRATCDNERNLSDEQVRAIAAGGGVIGIGYFDLAVCGYEPRDVVAAMRHVIGLVGDDFVALGSDYDGGTKVSFDTSRLRALTQQMLDDGLSEASVRKILGANALRVLRQTLPRR